MTLQEDNGMYGFMECSDFEFVQEKGTKQDGMKMRRLQVFCDTSPMIAEMRKRGMMNSDDHL